MAKIKACIFDLDGVIVDTAKFHYLAWKEMAKGFGYELSPEVNEKLKGVSRIESLDILLAEAGKSFSDAKKNELMHRKNERYLEYVGQLTPKDMLPGVKKFMRRLKDKDFKMAIGSSSKNAMRILAKLEITGYFDAIIDGNKIERGKPDPQIFIFAAEAMGVVPSQCVVFEDAPAGVEAAHLAGMFIIGVGDKEVLGRANLVIPGFQNIDLDIFDKL